MASERDSGYTRVKGKYLIPFLLAYYAVLEGSAFALNRIYDGDVPVPAVIGIGIGSYIMADIGSRAFFGSPIRKLDWADNEETVINPDELSVSEEPQMERTPDIAMDAYLSNKIGWPVCIARGKEAENIMMENYMLYAGMHE